VRSSEKQKKRLSVGVGRSRSSIHERKSKKVLSMKSFKNQEAGTSLSRLLSESEEKKRSKKYKARSGKIIPAEEVKEFQKYIFMNKNLRTFLQWRLGSNMRNKSKLNKSKEKQSLEPLNTTLPI
jgi:hypothetical protein